MDVLTTYVLCVVHVGFVRAIAYSVEVEVEVISKAAA